MLELVTEAAAGAALTPQSARRVVRTALIWASQPGRDAAPVLSAAGPVPGSVINIKLSAEPQDGLVGFKVGAYWPRCADGRPADHGAVTMLLNPDTGRPVALINVRAANRVRTAAAAAVSAEALARPQVGALAIIGAGGQAEALVRAVAMVRPPGEVRIGARRPEAGVALAARLADLGVPILVTSPQAAAEGAGLIITATPAQTPVLARAWVAPGAHICAMGADRTGKQELDPQILRDGRVFADLPQQARTIGECQHLAQAGRSGAEAITALGAVLAGQAPGRRDDQEITVFDSSGLALQDLLVAQEVLAEARARGLVQTLQF